jgi:peptidoglycan/xylan/chitin deacetylase (PgdA/CDA1 family)
MRRRRVLRDVATLVAGAAAGAVGIGGVDEYQQRHPTPIDRVSPLVQNQAICSSTPVVWRGDARQRRVALTFDDGPDPRWTPMALDLLARREARGTFFMLASAVTRYPETARAVFDAGHEIGNHGWDHRHMNLVPPQDLAELLDQSHRQIIETTGFIPRLGRPPYGQFDAATSWVFAQLGYPIVLWSHRMTADDPVARARDAIATAVNGMIVLSHDGRATPTVAQMTAADQLVKQLRQQGFEFVTVSELLH